MKRTYHTNLLIKYKLGALDIDTINKIPNSTLYNWKQKGFSHVFGLPDVNDSEIEIMRAFLSKKKLMNAAKALYYIFTVYQSFICKLNNQKKLFYETKELITDTIDRTKGILGFDKVLKAFNITSQTYYYWKNKIKCTDSLLSLCKIRHPLQLTNKEISSIKQYLTKEQFLNWSLSSVYCQMMRDKVAFMCIVTFYKYAKLLNLTRQKPHHRKKKHKIGIRAEKTLQILHADLTIFRPLDNTKVYIYFIADNFSRKILAWKASLEYSAKYTFENLQEVYEKHKIYSAKNNVDFMVDDGSENKAEVDTFIENSKINKVIAQKDVIFSNNITCPELVSGIEAVNKRIKYDFLFPAEIQNFDQTVKQLEKAVTEYNNKPYLPLHGLTPSEVFEGKILDKTMFSKQIAEAKQQRITENRKFRCINHK